MPIFCWYVSKGEQKLSTLKLPEYHGLKEH